MEGATVLRRHSRRRRHWSTLFLRGFDLNFQIQDELERNPRNFGYIYIYSDAGQKITCRVKEVHVHGKFQQKSACWSRNCRLEGSCLIAGLNATLPRLLELACSFGLNRSFFFCRQRDPRAWNAEGLLVTRIIKLWPQNAEMRDAILICFQNFDWRLMLLYLAFTCCWVYYVRSPYTVGGCSV